MIEEKKLIATTLRKLLNIPEDLPKLAQIEITNICNLDCKMCVRNFIPLEIKHMDFNLFKKIVDNLKGVNTLTLTGYGEPLLYPYIIEAIKYCKHNKFEVKITTNGLLLNSKKKSRELIESDLDAIAFSLESINQVNEVGHANLSALDNIKNLVELKKAQCSLTPMITLQTIMMKNKEQDLYDIIKWGGKNNIDRINIVRFDLNTLPNVKRPNIKEEKIIFKEVTKLRKKYGIRIDCIQDQVDIGLKGFLYKHLKYFLGMDKNCIRLQDFTYINVDGYVRSCCALVNSKMGSLLDTDLRQIWTSRKYSLFRKNYHNIPWCSHCDTFTLKQKQ